MKHRILAWSARSSWTLVASLLFFFAPDGLFAQIPGPPSNVTVQSTLTDGSGTSVAGKLYLHFVLNNCGANFPITSATSTIVKRSFDIVANSSGVASGTVVPNDVIKCGNVVSTQWAVSVMSSANSPITEAQTYFICSSAAVGLTCAQPSPGATFDISTAQPASIAPPSPDFVPVFVNPVQNQIVTQPAGTALDILGTFQLGQITSSSPQCAQFSTTGVLQGAGAGCFSGGFTAGQDLSGSTTSQEVIGILAHPLPSLASGCLNWNGTAWNFSGCSGGGGGSPGGANQQVQFNNGSAFGGGVTMMYNTSTTALDALNLAFHFYDDPNNPFFNWSFTDSGGSIGNLTSAGSGLTLTVPCTVANPCVGFDTSANLLAPFGIYISGTGTAEAVPVTAGTCTRSYTTSSCNLVVTTQNAHPNGYTISSSTTGIQEMFNYANINGTPHGDFWLSANNGSANPNYNLYWPLFFDVKKANLHGYGAQFGCFVHQFACVVNGDFSGGTGLENTIEGIEFQSHFISPAVNVASIAANGTYATVTTSTAHSFQSCSTATLAICNSWVIMFYSAYSSGTGNITQNFKGQVLTGSQCTPSCSSTQFQFLSTSNFSSTPAYGFAVEEGAAIDDYSAGPTVYRDIKLMTGGATNRLNYGLVAENNQSLSVDGFSTEGSSTVMNCTTTTGWCGAAIYGAVQYSAKAVFRHLNLSFQCSGNGIYWPSSNGITVDGGSVIQAYNQYGVLYGSGGLQSATFPDMYEEVSGACPNYAYPQTAGTINASAGVITNVGFANESDTVLASSIPVFPPTNTGSTVTSYWIVMKVGGTASTMPLNIGSSSSSGSGNITVYWPMPNFPNAALTFDLLAIQGGSPSAAPNGTGNYAVATGLTFGGNCNTEGICSYTDPQTGYSSYTVAFPTGQTLAYNFCPATYCLGSNAYANVVNTSYNGWWTTTWITPTGIASGKIFAQGSAIGYSPVFLVSTVGNQQQTGSGASLHLLGTSGSGQQGIIHFFVDNNYGATDWMTFGDANPALTLSKPGFQPPRNAGDCAISQETTGGVTASALVMGFRCPAAINFAINAFPTNAAAELQILPASITFNEPIIANAGILALGPGCYFGCGPALSGTQATPGNSTSTLNTFTSANYTQTEGTWTINSSGATFSGVGSGAFAIATYTGAAFNSNANQYGQGTIVSTNAGAIGVGVRCAASGSTGYYFWGNTTGSLLQYANAGTPTTLATGAVLPNGSVITLQVSGNTLTALINGVQAFAPVTDTHLSSGVPCVVGVNSTGSVITSLRFGDLSYQQNALLNFTVTPTINSNPIASYTPFASNSISTSCATSVTWTVPNSAPNGNGTLTTTGSCTLNLANLVDAGYYTVKVKQGGGGTLTLGATGCGSWKVANGGGGTVSQSSATNAIDILAFTYIAADSACYATYTKNFN